MRVVGWHNGRAEAEEGKIRIHFFRGRTPPVIRRLPSWVRVAGVLGVVLLLGLWTLIGHGEVGHVVQNEVGQGVGPFFSCPVAGGIVKDNFGTPRTGHTHLGNDILADWGTPVLATFSGNLLDSKSAGGRIVTLEAPDGSFTVGKHLSSTTTERQVQTGDIIGYVGELAAHSALPHLHFEWHPGGGPAVDPFAYLSEVCPNTWPRVRTSPAES